MESEINKKINYFPIIPGGKHKFIKCDLGKSGHHYFEKNFYSKSVHPSLYEK